MRRHAKASSAGSKLRKPSGHGASPPSGRLRLTILLATVAAFLLVPAAQAFAENTLTVNLAGTGSGEVSSVGGVEGEFEGEPPIECSGPPATGICTDTMVNKGGENEEVFFGCCGIKMVWLHVTVAPGSKFVGWTVEEGNGGFTFGCEAEEEEPHCGMYGTEGGDAKVTATFECEVEGGCKGGPTNRRLLTLTKTGSTGQGSVSSKPKGIKCASTCPTATANLYKETTVVLTAKAATTAGSSFESWEGCETETKSGTEGTCTVKLTEAKAVNAKFGGTKKAILNPVALTLTKAGNGYGTVKASGLACEADCTATEVEYTSGNGGTKLPATVTLVETPAPNSAFSGWEGCGSEPEGKCVVLMSEAKAVKASFTLLPVEALTLTKTGSSGQGSVSSKPKGIKCAATCPTANAALPQNTTVVLTAKAATTAGSTFESWEGCETETKSGTEGTCTVKLTEAKAVNAKFGGTKKAILNPVALTLTKAGSGYGTVKASGLACEPACTQTEVEYTSGNGGTKLPATVTLLASSAPGSKTVVWSGCESEPEGKCVVLMSEAKEVTATFDELE